MQNWTAVVLIVHLMCTVPCFSANKPTYTSGAYQSAQRAVVTPKSHTPVQASSAATYVYPANTSQPVSTYSTTTYATNTTASATYTGKGNLVYLLLSTISELFSSLTSCWLAYLTGQRQCFPNSCTAFW